MKSFLVYYNYSDFCSVRFLNFVICKNMSRLFWVFVLLAVIALPLCNARPHKCEQRERSLADLDLAEDSLNRAKQLYPDCEDESEISNSSECSKKDKSLGFIDVALELVSNAKKNIPICPHVPTEEPLTTTASPLTMTPSPLTMTPSPLIMTPSPLTMTPSPLTMTPSPLTMTPSPLTTTASPLTTTASPLTMTASPLTMTASPLTTTMEPLSTTVVTTPEVTTENISSMDCQELLAAGHITSGVYNVWPKGGKSAVRVRCDMDTDGGGWTVIQRRGNFSPQENFNRDWKDYKNGFGNLERDFWLGNDNIFALSNQGNYSLRMDMAAKNGDTAYALYQNFRIGDENTNYKLQVGGYKGTVGDCMYYSNSQMFSTKDKYDRRSSLNCAEERKGGWWYAYCARCNPNGLYRPGVDHSSSMHYMDFKSYVGLSSIDMKIKRQ